MNGYTFRRLFTQSRGSGMRAAWLAAGAPARYISGMDSPDRTFRRVLFICTGNYYRSRFAEAFFNARAEERGLAWRAISRGLATHLVEGDLSPHTADRLRRHGIERRHTAPTRQSLTEADLRAADRVIALQEAEHRPLMAAAFPAWETRAEYWGVADLDGAEPADALTAIERRVDRLLDDLAAREAADQPPRSAK